MAVDKRKTKLSVRLGDMISRYTITVGGIGTIASVLLVAFFLLYQVIPLFLPGDLHEETIQDVQNKTEAEVVHMRVEDYRLVSYAVREDASVVSYSLLDGKLFKEFAYEGGEEVSAVWTSPFKDALMIGSKSGKIIEAEITFETDYIAREQLAADAKLDESIHHADGVATLIDKETARYQYVSVAYAEPYGAENTPAITKLDRIQSVGGNVVAAYHADNRLRLYKTKRQRNLMTGKYKTTVRTSEIAVDGAKKHGQPIGVNFLGQGENVLVLWKDGYYERYNTRKFEEPYLAESGNLEFEGSAITANEILLGSNSVLVGSETGEMSVWFLTDALDGKNMTPDAKVLSCGHRFASLSTSPVKHIGSSRRMRMMVVGHENNDIHLYHVTSERHVAQATAQGKLAALGIAPRDDAVFALTDAGIEQWWLDTDHPDITMASLFLPVWYEGYNEPIYKYQAEGGSDDDEGKISLIPLIFGTIKATIYSMLIAVPIALAAAIYTSEFMHVKLKNRIKPTVELMASLPSVILGFVGGIVLAPIVARNINELIVAIYSGPLIFYFLGLVWQFIPARISNGLQRYRLLFIFGCFFCIVLCSWIGGPIIEAILFSGDVLAWLNNQDGYNSNFPGWFLLLIPIFFFVITIASELYVTPRMIRRPLFDSRKSAAFMRIGQALVHVAAAVGCAAVCAAVFGLVLGWDVRGSIIDTYESRNAFVVGIVMGFAVIPIVYTIAEDALSTVPQHLRAASLGSGATPWQTAVRVVIPTAMSGMFSAIMVGLGRAVGETMIVLMAAGNTPVMEWNIFNGFRTLSANIAVEMPEAAVGSTHYRVLFLAAFTLFVMTFILNTIAELVRQRFRKRAVNL